ncbi:hypothetical protein GCM10022233_56690 [Streptomyces shaanxiensis]|uniref:Uncharacterized protein n=1 Tax=Streptomyces shaanxiensis TaxID=653357 RepID=A0ABP7VQL7_9ACTN
MTRIDDQGAMESWIRTELWHPLRLGVSQMPKRPEQPSTEGSVPVPRYRPKGFRAALRWQIIALAAFAICFCTLAVGWHITDRPTAGIYGGSSAGTDGGGDPRTDSTDPGTGAGTDPGTGAGTDPGAGGGAEEGTGGGTEPAPEPTLEEPAAEEPAAEDQAVAEQTPGPGTRADIGAINEGGPAPAHPASVLALVIAGVSGVGGFLSGAAAMITARQGARQGRRQQTVHTRHAWHPSERHRLRLRRPRGH